jgi:flap endonuclease-1
MGVKITDLVVSREIDFRDLAGRIIVVDASLFLYQFLTTIRQPDGSPLMDSQGQVTSHLVGLFSRTARLMQCGIKLAYVFDGKPPGLKFAEQSRRHSLKVEAKEKYDSAAEIGDVDEMRKYAGRTSRLSPEMVVESKDLLSALGIPVIQAASEAEAQASFIVKNGDAFAIATQDADALMFGAPRIAKNLSLIGKKKQANRLSYQNVRPEIIDLADTLNSMGVDQDQLIALCMLVGTDYNPGGIKGIGPRGALKLVKEHKGDFKQLFASAKWDDFFPSIRWEDVFYTIKDIPVSKDYGMQWAPVDDDGVLRLLVDKHNFSQERTAQALSKLAAGGSAKKQRGLSEFF